MLYQEEFESKVKNFKVKPQSMILTGDIGSEFDEAISFILDKLNLQRVDIEKVDDDIVDLMSTTPNDTLYVIDIDNLVKQHYQDKLLKSLEEPNPFCYILIYGVGINKLKETIINRCFQLELKSLTRDQVSSITNDVNLINLCVTKGQVEQASHYNLNELDKLCKNIIDNIGKASYCNMLKIADKINFNKDEEKYPYWLFTKMLKLNCKKKSMLLFLLEFEKNYNNLLDKRRYFESCLSKIWLDEKVSLH